MWLLSTVHKQLVITGNISENVDHMKTGSFWVSFLLFLSCIEIDFLSLWRPRSLLELLLPTPDCLWEKRLTSDYPPVNRRSCLGGFKTRTLGVIREWSSDECQKTDENITEVSHNHVSFDASCVNLTGAAYRAGHRSKKWFPSFISVRIWSEFYEVDTKDSSLSSHVIVRYGWAL